MKIVMGVIGVIIVCFVIPLFIDHLLHSYLLPW